ncbi:MAG: T9SS type A sorting domain-containing protein [Bacteroidales bacterium]|nr:T9SS type A sorting domain-containing protein [Bacteroidales bacterium]
MTKIYQKVSILLVLLTFTALASQAQELKFTLVSTSNSEAVIQVDFPNYQTSQIVENGENMQSLHMDKAYPMQNAGEPELLQAAISLIIPEGSRPTVDVLNTDFEMVQGVNLAPSKGRLYRNVDPATVPYQKGAAYQEDRFLYNDTVVMDDPYLLRDYFGISFHFFPFAYNPVQQTLKVYHSITVKVHFNSHKSVTNAQKLNRTFDAIYSDHFLNYKKSRSNQLPEEGEILILSPQEFCEAMQPYAAWKNKSGFKTTIVSLDSVGSTSSVIKQYITNYYDNHNLTYVVLVGDKNKFPVLQASGNASDNYYGEVAGNDHYPDVIIGKISAETVAHVNTQVERFIQYEQNPPLTAHLSSYMGIASNQGPGDNGEYDYQHMHNISNILTSYTYEDGYEFFEGNQGGLDANGDPSASQIAEALNNGVGIVNYCGHGDVTLWSTSNFNVSDINNLNNAGKLPFIISVACLNGQYPNTTCFAEAWLRATKNGEPTGAVSVLMSSISQPWNPPMCGQDRMNELITGANDYSRMYTFGSIAFNGIIAMLDNYGDYETARTWILFGDPALHIRTAEPQEMNLTYNQYVPINSSQVGFNSTVENATVTLSKNNQLISTGRINNGFVTLDISPAPVLPDTFTVLATAPNYLPFEGRLFFVPSDGPFVVCSSLTAVDGNDNEPASGEFSTLNVQLYNIGNQAGDNVYVNVYTDDPYLSIWSDGYIVNRIDAGETKSIEGSFFMQVYEDVPAFHKAVINVEIVLGGDTNLIKRSIVLHAPKLFVRNVRVDDAVHGNNNGKADFGETFDLVFTIGNEGNGDAKAGHLDVSVNEPSLLQLSANSVPTSALDVDASEEVRVTTTIAPAVTENTLFRIKADYAVCYYHGFTVAYVAVGERVEDFESGDFSSYDWNTGSNNTWQIVNQNVYEGNYAARSASIGNNSSSVLSLTASSTSADSISFYYKVSSEEGYDFLNFYIDNAKREAWSGDVGWARAAFAVPAGQHTYKWEYKKDQWYSSGQDRAMIDLVRLPNVNVPTSIEALTSSTIVIMPNPTSDNIHLILDEGTIAQNAQYQLYDMTGRVLRHGNVVDSNQTIAMDDLSNGIYLLKISANGKTCKTFKIVKQ